MAPYKCCVGGCDATSNTHKLFCMPMNDNLRNLWLSFLVPTNPALLGLTKNQLMTKRVCERHFDQTQFDQVGVRIRYSYPCLFTEMELEHGVPLAKGQGKVLDEHNYCQSREQDNDDSAAVPLTIKDDISQEYQYSPPSTSPSPVTPLLQDEGKVTVDLISEISSAFEQAEEGKDLHELPPVTFDHVDVTRLLKDITTLKTSLAEMQSKLEVANNTIGELRAEVVLLRNTVSASRSPDVSNVNRRRGAQNATISSFESASSALASQIAVLAYEATCTAANVAATEATSHVGMLTPKLAYTAIVATSKPAVSQTNQIGGKQGRSDSTRKVLQQGTQRRTRAARMASSKWKRRRRGSLPV